MSFIGGNVPKSLDSPPREIDGEMTDDNGKG
jgi:hypothetical protein